MAVLSYSLYSIEMNNMITSIFANKLDVDERLPLFLVSVGGHQLGLYAPHIMFWVQLLVGIAIFVAFTVFMASIIYFVIIPRKRSMLSFLVGYGILIPLILYFPFLVLDILDIRSHLLRFSMSAVFPVLTMFRTSEAIFGYSPSCVEYSYKNYVLYYIAAVETQFEKSTNKPIRASWDDKMQSLKHFAFWLIALSAYKSLLRPSGYELFETTVNGNETGYNFLGLVREAFDINSLRNNFILTMLLQLYISTFIGALIVLATIILGVKVKDGMMKNPLLKASSPSDFWSGRWNLLVQGGLKRGVFKPAYSVTSSKFIAILATFLASGLFHEFILIASFPPHLDFTPALGKNTVFMMWNAVVIIMETLIGKAQIFCWMKKNLPQPLLTAFVLLSAMPLAHWFLHPYTKSEIFTVHGEIAMPMIKIIN